MTSHLQTCSFVVHHWANIMSNPALYKTPSGRTSAWQCTVPVGGNLGRAGQQIKNKLLLFLAGVSFLFICSSYTWRNFSLFTLYQNPLIFLIAFPSSWKLRVCQLARITGINAILINLFVAVEMRRPSSTTLYIALLVYALWQTVRKRRAFQSSLVR